MKIKWFLSQKMVSGMKSNNECQILFLLPWQSECLIYDLIIGTFIHFKIFDSPQWALFQALGIQ